jgi:streptomycin 6-kinase
MDVFIKTLRPDEIRAAEALRHFGDHACAKVIGAEDDKLLLERLHPGTPLIDLVADQDDIATGHICDIAARLHARGMPETPWPTVEEWGRGFDWYRKSGDRSIKIAHVDRAAELFASLAASQTSRCFLHGDLHHENILFSAERGWLAIDPKGVIGESAYEFACALRQDSARIERRSHIIAERTGLDRQRLLDWAYAQAVLSAIWCVEDTGHL